MTAVFLALLIRPNGRQAGTDQSNWRRGPTNQRVRCLVMARALFRAAHVTGIVSTGGKEHYYNLSPANQRRAIPILLHYVVRPPGTTTLLRQNTRTLAN